MKKCREVLKKINNWIAVDGKLHIMVSLIVYTFTSITLLVWTSSFIAALIIAFTLTLAVGLWKEYIDMYIQKDNSTQQSNHDLICNLIGTAIGILFLVFINAIL